MKLNRNASGKRKKPAENRAGSGGRGKRAALIGGFAVVAVLLSCAAAGVSYVNKIDTIFPNVRLDGMEIGGLTLNETVKLLEENGYAGAGDAAVTAELPLDVTLSVRADEVCTETPVNDIAVMAYDACKGGSATEDAMTYLRCLTGGMELQSERAMTVDASAVRAKVEAAAKEVQLAVLGSDLKIGEERIAVTKGASGVRVDCDALTEQIVDAFNAGRYEVFRYEAEIQTDTELDVDTLYDTVFTEKKDACLTEDCEVAPEVVGVSFDKDEAKRLWDAAMYGETVEIPLVFDEPELTAAELEAVLFRDQLAAMSTSLSGSSANRVNNVSLAAQKINGIILMPGDEFDYNKALGKRTAENGFLPAGAYSDGQVVQEYGGGICQVSSTLYYCCLCSNLKISTRTAHYFPVSYLPAGLDATVSWGGPEYRFVNNREYPIKIVAYVEEDGKNVTVELWGTDTDGSYVEMTYSTELVYDEEYPDVAIGYKARTYRSVFAADGTLLSRKEETNSFYHYHDEDIEWPEETPEPTEPPAETPTPTEPPAETPTPTEAPVETPTPTPTEAPIETPEPTEPPVETPEPTEPPVETPEPTEPPAAETPAPTEPVGDSPEA